MSKLSAYVASEERRAERRLDMIAGLGGRSALFGEVDLRLGVDPAQAKSTSAGAGLVHHLLTAIRAIQFR